MTDEFAPKAATPAEAYADAMETLPDMTDEDAFERASGGGGGAAALVMALAALARDGNGLDLTDCDDTAMRVVYVCIAPWIADREEDADASRGAT
jgi:hypothetical protein